MKKEFQSPKLEFLMLSCEEIIRTSGEAEANTADDLEWDYVDPQNPKVPGTPLPSEDPTLIVDPVLTMV